MSHGSVAVWYFSDRKRCYANQYVVLGTHLGSRNSKLLSHGGFFSAAHTR